MADLPLWRAVEAIQDIQRLRRGQPEDVPEEIDALTQIVFDDLGEHTASMRAMVDAALTVAPDDDVQRRLDDAVAALESVQSSLPYAPVGFPMEQTSFAAGQEHAIRLQLVAHGAGTLLEHRFVTPSHCRSRIVLRYEPATATAEALLSSAGRLAAPSFAVDLRPLLEIHHPSGEISRVEGTGRIPAGTPLFLAIAFERPGLMSGRHATEARPLAGGVFLRRVSGARGTLRMDPRDRRENAGAGRSVPRRLFREVGAVPDGRVPRQRRRKVARTGAYRGHPGREGAAETTLPLRGGMR